MKIPTMAGARVSCPNITTSRHSAPAPVSQLTVGGDLDQDMSFRLRKVFLTSHITSSVGWLGAVAAYLVLARVGSDQPG